MSRSNGKDTKRPVKQVLTPEEWRILKPMLMQDPPIEKIKVKDIIIDDGEGQYQDREREKYVALIAEQFVPGMMGVITVSERPDGTLHCPDGATRVLGVRRRGSPDEVNAQRFKSSGEPQEALFLSFANSTRARNPVKLITKLQSEAIAGTDMGFGALLERCGFTLRKGKMQIHGPGYVVKAFYMDDCQGKALERALFTVKEAWRSKYNYKIFGYAVLGVAMLYHSQRKSIDEAVRNVLKKYSPDDLMKRIIDRFLTASESNKPRLHPDQKPTLMSAEIARLINAHPPKTGKVDIAALNRVQEEYRNGEYNTP